MAGEARVLRDRLAEAEESAGRRGWFGEGGSAAILVQTKAVTTYPSSASSFFACSPMRIDGPESEGAAASFSADSSRTLFAYNLGSGVPPAGTKLLAQSCGGRWTFRYDG